MTTDTWIDYFSQHTGDHMSRPRRGDVVVRKDRSWKIIEDPQWVSSTIPGFGHWKITAVLVEDD